LLQKLTPTRAPSYSFSVADRDLNGMTSLSELRGKGINLAASALAQSTDHILSFFNMLRAELGFYVACLNLYEQLVEKAEPTCFPVPLAAGKAMLAPRQLYDVSLAFHLDSEVVGNDVDADGRALVMITGANQGGKSTFLRSVGLAQLMMQAGMFVGAESFAAHVCDGVFTHFKREEDATMTRGKLEEELHRMSEIADAIRPTSLLLCNESFASTSEREGSEIARQVVGALIEAGVKVFFVTHLFDLTNSAARSGALPPRRAAAGRPAHLSAPGRGATADELRTGVLPADLRRRSRAANDGRSPERLEAAALQVGGYDLVLLGRSRPFPARPPARVCEHAKPAVADRRAAAGAWDVALSVAFWRKGDSRARVVTTFRRFVGSGSERDSPACRRRTTFRHFGWGGLPTTSLAAHARPPSCLEALSNGSIELAACRAN
jgi:hypothetical protein